MIYSFLVVISRKVLEFFITNWVFVYFLSVFVSRSLFSFRFLLNWLVFGIIMVLISERVCLNFERSKRFTFNDMLDVTERPKIFN